MSQLRLGLVIDTTAKGDGIKVALTGVEKLGTGAKEASGKVRALTDSTGGLTSSIARMAATLGVAAAAWKAFDFVKDMVTQGIQFNATMETSRLGIAALIGAFGEVRDSSGNLLTDFNANLRVATELQQKLKLAALQTTASYEDMVLALQVGVGPALKAGFNTEQIVEFTKMATQAAGAIGLPMNQLGQEIRALFAGDIGPDSRLANLLFTDKPRNKIKAYVEELQKSGKFFEEMTKRMGAFAEAGERAGNTMAGAWSNLKDALSQALGEGTQGQFSRVTSLILGMTAQVVTFDEKGRAIFNQDFIDGVEAITAAFAGLAKEILTAVSNLGRFVDFAGATKDWAKGFAADRWWELSTVVGTFGGQNGLGSGTRDYVDFDELLSERIRKREQRQQNRANRTDDDRRLQELMESGSSAGAEALRQEILRRGITVSGRGATATEPDKKVIALKNAVDDLTASTAVFLEQQAKLANAAGFEALVARDQAAIKRLDAQQDERAARFDALLAATRDPIKKIEIERESALDKMDTDAKKFALQQSIARNELRAALQALDDELTAFRAKQDKELQDYMQKGVKFGTPQYREVLDAQEAQYKAFTDRQAAQRSNLNEKLQDIETAQTDFEKVEAAKRVALNADADAKIADEAFDRLTERAEKQREFYNEILLATRSFTQRMKDLYRDMADQITASIKTGVTSLLEGGDLQDAMDGMVRVLNDMIAESFGGLFDAFFQRMAAHAQGQPGPGEIGPPSPRQQRNARGGMMAIQAGSALYGLYTNPAPKQGQNMLSGAMSGAAIGAQVYGVYGAIIGAVIGAIAGAFAPTEEGKNIQIRGTGGVFGITGMDGEDHVGASWGKDKLTKAINQAVRGTAAKLDAIFLGLPTAALEALGNWRPNLDEIDVSGKADGKNWNEELDHYLRETLPARVFDAYGAAIQGALKFAGVTDQRLQEFTEYIKNLTVDEAIKATGDYINVVMGLFELLEMFGGQATGGRRRAVGSGGVSPDRGEMFTRNVYANADRGPLAAFEDIAKRVAALSRGFDDLTHEEQVARGQQILDLSQQFFQGVEEYLLKLRDMQRAMNDSIDAQLRDIALDQLTDPQQKVEFLLDEQRRLRDQLGQASTAEEVNDIISRMQQNAAALYDLLGRTPEAAEMIRQQLEDMRAMANARYEVFHENAEQMLNDAYEMVNSILKRLQEGLDDVFTPPGDPNAPPGGGDTGPITPPPDPSDGGLTDFITAAQAATAGFNEEFTPSIGDATAKILSFADALDAARTTIIQPNVNVELGDFNVDVQVSGTAERMIDEVSARVANASTSRVMTALEKRAARSRMTGRR